MKISRDWVIAKREHVDVAQLGVAGVRRIEHETYWTGGLRGRGTSVMPADAYHFSSYSAALECTWTHDELRDSDEWRIVPADRRRSLQQVGN